MTASILTALFLLQGAAASNVDGLPPSVTCVYESLSLAEREAVQSNELRDPSIGLGAHQAARAKFAEQIRACAERWGWSREDGGVAGIYLATRTALESSLTQLAKRGVKESVVDDVIAGLSSEQHQQVITRGISQEVGVTIGEIAFKDSAFREAAEDEMSVPSAGRLLGRAVAGKIFMDALARGDLSTDALKAMVQRAEGR